MEEFYKMLKEYNQNLHKKYNLDKWHKIYTEDKPPLYFSIIYEILKNTNNKNKFIIEIGSGFGDIIALLIYLGFNNIIGFERNKFLAELSDRKIKDLFGFSDNYILNSSYPMKLENKPDIYIQVNNVYVDNIQNKEDYIKRTLDWINYNGKPKTCLIEFIDGDHKTNSKVFPDYVRLSKDDIKEMFNEYSIKYFQTYKYPINTSSKILYNLNLKEI